MRLPTLPLRRAATGAMLLALAAPALHGQRIEPLPQGVSCDYRHCAYNIIPAGLGLRVVRGESEVPVASLGFLWTRDISDVFDGEGQAAAKAAVRTRRWAALFTDVGLGLLVVGAAGALADDLDDTTAALMLGGAASVGVSIPLQFLADKHLARAVWQHNARYAGGTR